MAEQITREDALRREGYRHACHIMLYGDSSAKLFGKIPIKHIVLMQMRFDGLLGFPGGLEVGVAVPVGVDNHVSSCLSPSCPRLITHFYVKKMTESELKEMERAAVATATDHGLEVLGMFRVPLYFLKNGGGLPYFLSHSFISNSRAQLLSALQRCGLLSQGELEKAVRQAEQMRLTRCGDPH
ncbi:U8 snoRNA-decapping enzyme-like isoform X4 [Sinocyclocheilus rhinocerous]|uniref:U8 snoRNA-decapping enzyme-like isoform X4 n=1 Tax=Sinocyclocheilus rhinocerous TaxID=307959 RepID=UPI0007B850CD|nr:PREDICTED: U8 snoRNA-decapping enzyme-like isoform X4 [Sinocyclocheilus rhinocerous]